MSAPIPESSTSVRLPVERPIYNPRLTAQDLLTIPSPTTNQWLASVRADDHQNARVTAPNSALRQLTTCDLLAQLHTFRMRNNEFANIDMYDLRLRELIHQLKTAADEPQPISREQHKRVYLAGLRAAPRYKQAITTLTDIDNKNLKYIHDVMRAVCSEASRIRANHATPTPRERRIPRHYPCCPLSSNSL